MQSTKSAVKFVNLACSGVSNADQISNLTVVMNASTLTGVSHVKVIVCIAPFMHIYIHHVQWICNVICIACYGGSVSFICHQGWVPGVWQFLHSEHPCLLQNKAIWWEIFVIIVILQVLTMLWTWLLMVGPAPCIHLIICSSSRRPHNRNPRMCSVHIGGDFKSSFLYLWPHIDMSGSQEMIKFSLSGFLPWNG